MKKLSKEQCRLCASNAAHKALKNRADSRGDQLKKMYHGSCIIRQEKAGRVFTLAERKKIFDSVIFVLRSDNKNKGKKYSEFLKAGGGLSGVYDISNRETLAFVKKYREFILGSEIYTRDKRGYLVPVYGKKQ